MMLSNLYYDVRYCLRGFLKRPGFAVIVVTTLAVGIGVNVAIYSIFEQALIRQLPVRDPDSLVNLAAPGPKPGSTSCGIAGDCEEVFSYPMFRDLERAQMPFVGIAAHRLLEANLAFDGRSRSGSAMFVSGSYFDLLGVQPALGRLLGPRDDRIDGAADTVVLGYAYWRDSLGADPGVIGRTLVVNGTSLTVVGVAPRGFSGTTNGARPQVYVPITFRWLDRPGALPNHEDRRRYWTYLFARLKPGFSIEQAAAAINAPYTAILNETEAALQSGISEQTLAQFRAKTITVSPGARGQSVVGAGAQLPLTLLLLVTGTVLLIACVNIANLMLARGAGRIGEMAVRASMGAAPPRLAALLLSEAVLLTVVAAALSLPFALVMLTAISTFVMPDFAADALDVSLNGRMVMIAVLVAFVCAGVFSLFPVLKLVRAEPAAVLRMHGARTTGGKMADRFRITLVTGQIAMSMILLVFAGLLAQSLANILHVDLGMRVESVLAFSISPELNGYPAERSRELFDRIEEELGALPGVKSVGSSTMRLLNNSNWSTNMEVEGFEADPDTNTDAQVNFVGPGFFRTLELPLLAGRVFTDADAIDRPNVAIVNQRFVERFGLGSEAVGKRVGMFDSGLTIEIAGVVQNAKYDNVKDNVRPQIFRPRRQAAALGSMTFYLRVSGDHAALGAGIRGLVARHDPELPVDNLHTMSNQIRENIFLERFTSLLAIGMAVLATLLAAMGLYGVLSYTVSQRTREIGLRLALGATPGRLRGMVLRQIGWMVAIGGVIGLGATLLLGRAASALLFGLQATDACVLLTAVAMLALVAIGAGYLPARRASRIDPMVALRDE